MVARSVVEYSSNNEKVVEYFNMIMSVTNQMKSCSENISNQNIMNNVMCTISFKFYYIEVAVKESKDLFIMKIEEF